MPSSTVPTPKGSEFRPDPRPNLDRDLFRDTWRSLQLLKEPHAEQLRRIEQAEANYLTLATGGEEPEAWCEGCGAPFFEGDDYQSDDEGIATCRFDADGKRVGRCFAEMMGE